MTFCVIQRYDENRYSVAMNENLKKIRKKLGLTQHDVAEQLGVSFETYNKLENGKRQLTHKRMLQLAAIFNCSVESLLGGAPSISVMVKGVVAAGLWLEQPEWPQDDWYEISLPYSSDLAGRDLHGAKIKGQSMNLVYPEDSIVVFDTSADGMRKDVNKRYIVERRRASGEYEHTAKTLIKDDRGSYWLKPESDDPEFQTTIRIDGDDEDQIVIKGRIVFALIAQ